MENPHTYRQKATAPEDFARAFKHSAPLLRLRLQCEVADHRLSAGIANDTMAALLQARDLIAAIHATGLTVPELQAWVVGWGREWKEQETLTAALAAQNTTA